MKININCVLDNKTAKCCKEINAKIKESVTNEIDFSDNTCRPHITLLMGQVEEKDLEKVKEIVNRIDFKCLNKKVIFEKPVVENKYIMLNVKNRDSFKEDCDMLMKKLGDLIIPGQYNISNGTAIPHITLGFSKNAEKLSENIVSMCKIENATIQNIDVSPAGKHGVVLLSDNNLEAFM